MFTVFNYEERSYVVNEEKEICNSVCFALCRCCGGRSCSYIGMAVLNYTYVAGSVLPKDPTPTVKANSADAYVFVVVENENSDIFSVDIQSGWTEIAESADKSKTVYVYKEVVKQDKTEDTKLDAVFTKVTVSSELTSDKLASLNSEEFIKATAYAIQAQAIDKKTAFDKAVENLLGENVTVNYSVSVKGAADE